MHIKQKTSNGAVEKRGDEMELDCKQKTRSGEVALSDGCVVIHLSDLTSGDKVKERKPSMTGKLPRKEKRVVQHSPKTAARSLRSVTCDWKDCEKTFTSFYAMSAHYRTHTGQRPYACTAIGCNKSFRSSSDLQRHNRTHTGEKPYECMFHGCFKSFSTLAIRKVHMRTHTGERPYSCEYPDCSMTFSSLTNYKNHSRTHTGEKPFVCQHPGCGKRFAEYSTMRKHKVVHLESLMVCGACGRRFRHAVTYQAHRKREHAWMFAEDEDDTVIKTEAGAVGDSEPPRIQLLLTELDVRTVEIDGAATSVLVLPAEGDGAEVAGEGSDLQLLGCTEALVVSDDASSEQLVLQGEVASGVLGADGAAGEVLVEGQVPLVLRGEGAAGEVLVEGQVPLVLREEVLHGADDAPVNPDDPEPADAGLRVVEEQT